MSDLHTDVERFLTREAHLLDERRYEEWLALYDEDAWYWAPTHPKVTDRRFATAHINDDHQMMQVRVQRLGQDNAYTEQPQSRAVPLRTKDCPYFNTSHETKRIAVLDPFFLAIRSFWPGYLARSGE